MNILTECNLAKLVVDILDGKTVVFPTETTYGLGCDATNQKAVDEIFKVKGRSDDKPLLIVVPNVFEAKKYLEWNAALETLATKHWPGPLTIVSRYTGAGGLASGVVGKDGTVAVRVTAHLLLKSITEKLGRPLVATSANVAGSPSLYDSGKIVEIFKTRPQQPDIVLNYGELPVTAPTTLVDVASGVPKVLRQGGVVI